MTVAPDEFNFLEDAEADLLDIADSDPDAGRRIRSKIEELREQTTQWGRVPQEHLTYLQDAPPEHNLYRQKVGSSEFRVIYEISRSEMLVVAVLPRTDRTYQLDQFAERVEEHRDDS